MNRKCQFLGGPIEGLHVIPDDASSWKVPVRRPLSYLNHSEDGNSYSFSALTFTTYRRTFPHVFVHDSELP